VRGLEKKKTRDREVKGSQMGVKRKASATERGGSFNLSKCV